MKRLFSVCLLFATSFAGSLPSLKYRALDNDGDPISAAKIYFYQSGTTTPQATYPTEADEIAETNANANPVVCDGNGWCGEVFLQTDKTYKVVMKSSDDATTYFTVDNIDGTTLNNADIQTRLAQAATNPLDYGAVGDGVADESSEVQSAIDAATGVVDLLGKTYRCDSALSIDTGENGVVIKNGKLDFSNSNESYDIQIYGTAGAQNLLTGDVAVGDLTIAVTSASGLAADDLLWLYSTDKVATSVNRSEIVQVESIAALVVTLKEPVEFAYTTANTAQIKEITPVERVRFENVHIVTNPTSSGSGTSVRTSNVNNITFDKCKFEDFEDYGVNTYFGSNNVKILNSEFISSGASARALYSSGASREIVFEGNNVYGILTGADVGQGGYTDVHVSIKGNVISGTTRGVMSKWVWGLEVVGNTIIGNTAGAATSGDGIYVQAPNFRIADNSIREMGGNGILVDTDAWTYDLSKDLNGFILGNSILEPDEAGIDVQNASSPALSHVLIADNIVYGGANCVVLDHGGAIVRGNSCGTQTGITLDIGGRSNILIDSNRIPNAPAGNAIDVAAGSSLITISNNIIDGTPAHGILFADSADGIAITGNTIAQDASDTGIEIGGTTDGPTTIAGNTITAGAYGIELNGAGAPVTVSGNTLYNQTTACVYLVGANNWLAISANNMRGVAGIDHATSADTDHMVISGNIFAGISPGGGSAVKLIDGVDTVITGNRFELFGDTVPNINLAGDAAGVVDGVVITGNYLDNGTYGIGEATDANNVDIFVSGNHYDSVTTAEYQGTVTPGTVALSAANTACNTTCGTLSYSCLYGFDEATTGVDCADAAADYCICYP